MQSSITLLKIVASGADECGIRRSIKERDFTSEPRETDGIVFMVKFTR